MSVDLWKLSAKALRAGYLAKDFTAVQVVQSILDRSAEMNPKINALVSIDNQAALDAAAAADMTFDTQGAAAPALTGIPVTTKINTDQHGKPTTNGIEAAADAIAEHDSPPVRNLHKAGAILFGRSNAPAFSLRWFTDNDLHGRTLNPWNPQVSPGGSSGGAAAAVAAGMGPIAQGNDYGGSIRHPAAMCGVVGLRPSTGRVAAFNPTSPSERPISSQLFSVQGPLARCVDDAAMALDVMSAHDPRDPYQIPMSSCQTAKPPQRIAVLRSVGFADVSPAVTRGIDRAAETLTKAGIEVVEIEPPHFEEATEIWRTLVYSDVRRVALGAITELGGHAVKTNITDILAEMPVSSEDTLLNLYARRLAIARAWSEFFDAYPVLLTAVSWRHGLPIDADLEGPAALTKLIATQSPLLGTAMIGLPGLTVPIGVDAGLPVGVQLSAAMYREDLLIATGRILEEAHAPLELPG